MSRQSMMPQRNLTITEELERLEQSITLTLQEIDHNFSKAHRIVTSSIIPIVEQCAKHSDAVCDGSKFWKQFFEASANVSLSSYEEPLEEDSTEVGQGEEVDDRASYGASQEDVDADDTVTMTQERPTPRSGFDENDATRSTIPDSPSVTLATVGTPRSNQRVPSKARDRASNADSEASFAEYPSPYETLKAELKPSTNQRPQSTSRPRSQDPPTTPGQTRTATQFADSSPIPIPPSTQHNTAPRNPDRLLHNLLDKNYRLRATPHTAQRTNTKSPNKTSPSKRSPQKTTISNQPTAIKRNTHPALDSSPFSPAPAAPQLRSEIFGSPAVRRTTNARQAPRTPGVSVLPRPRFGGGAAAATTSRTPGPFSARKSYHPPSQAQAQTPGLFSPSPAKSKSRLDDAKAPASAQHEDIWSDDEDSLDLEMSPPKTMQFHIPQSRLLQTPAREASKRIVEGLLKSVGGESTVESEDLQRLREEDELMLDFDDEDDGQEGEASPSVIRARKVEGDDTF